MRFVTTAGLLILCSGLAFAQDAREAAKPEQNTAPATVRLRVQSRIDLPATLVGGYTEPVRCDGGKVYTQFISPTHGVGSPTDGLQGFVGISRDGKVTRFSLPKDAGVQQPLFVSAYPAGGFVIVHLLGQTRYENKGDAAKGG